MLIRFQAKSTRLNQLREFNKPQKHDRGLFVTFSSNTAIRNIIIQMGNIIQKAIAADAVATGSFSLERDSTQDINVKDQILVQEILSKMVTLKVKPLW